MKHLFAAAAAALVLASASGAAAAVVAEVEGNNSLATAQNLDPFFSLESDPDIFDSTITPHVTVAGAPGDGTYDFFKFTVGTAGVQGTFDIDYARGFYDVSFDPYISLFDEAGFELASNDDGGYIAGDVGTYHNYDSFLQYTFANTGAYFLRVGNCCVAPQGGGSGYELQVSIGDHPLASPSAGAVPEPATWAMMLMGFFGLGGVLRTRRSAVAA